VVGESLVVRFLYLPPIKGLSEVNNLGELNTPLSAYVKKMKNDLYPLDKFSLRPHI